MTGAVSTAPLFRRGPTLLLALLAQALLLARTYSKLLFHPGQYLIVDHYDGIKSYFSVASFLRQPLGSGMLVRAHNYPFGEYMYYTDSTPLVVAPLHWLVQTVPALGPYGVYLYDLFILSSLVVSTALLILILRRLALPAWFAGLLAVALPWLGPQTIRLNVGHMSLAYTPAVLLGIWGLQRLYAAWRAGQPLGRHFAALGLGIVAASWLHFYYLPIVGGLLGFFALGLLYESRRLGQPWPRQRPLVLGTAATLFGSLALTWGLLQVLDPRIRERPVGGGGYDWVEWRFQLTALFKGYSYNEIRFPLERMAYVPYESSAYLTSFVLFGLLLIAALILFRRLPAAAHLPSPEADDNARFVKYLLLASIPMAFIALGETIELDNSSYVVHNYLNVFMWMRKFSDRITQFRTLARFVWPFWWAVVLGFSWYIARWRRLPGLRWALAALCGLLLLDTLDATDHYRTDTQRTNLLTDPAATGPARDLVGWMEPGRYQAILPLPYFHVGTEPAPGELSVIIDPDDPHSNMTYQLSMVTGLPLMSNKSARTPIREAQLLYSVLQPGGPDPELLARLDYRPILVYLDSGYYNGSNNYYRDQLKDRPEMRALFERMPDFIREQHLRRLSHEGNRSLYEWLPKGRPAAQP